MLALQRQLAKLSSVYGIETPFFGIIKEAIKLTGLAISTEVLAPVKKPAQDKVNRLKEVLTFAEIPFSES